MSEVCEIETGQYPDRGHGQTHRPSSFNPRCFEFSPFIANYFLNNFPLERASTRLHGEFNRCFIFLFFLLMYFDRSTKRVTAAPSDHPTSRYMQRFFCTCVYISIKNIWTLTLEKCFLFLSVSLVELSVMTIASQISFFLNKHFYPVPSSMRHVVHWGVKRHVISLWYLALKRKLKDFRVFFLYTAFGNVIQQSLSKVLWQTIGVIPQMLTHRVHF